ncbi:MAG TPA: DUF5698 domain-containing protein [Tepidisphaeraceae bacterium]|nr:DUF5698 domain-containing protein [Tepidisphaeraceae bacterium]
MTLSVILTALVIMLARVTDISADTVRTVSIVQGRRFFAAILGFAEALIYILAIAQVLQGTFRPIFAVAYAAGFALGTFLGIVIEQRLAFGEQLVSVFTRKGALLVDVLRAEGYRVTALDGAGRDGPVQVLYIEVPRRLTKRLTTKARELDNACFYVVNDVRMASTVTAATEHHRVAA